MQKESKLNFELSHQNKLISDEADKLANTLELTLEEKELLQRENKSLIEEIQNSKNAEKESQFKLQAIKQEFQELRVIAYSTQAIAKTYINKFYSSNKEPINSIITKQFADNIKDYFEFLNKNANSNNAYSSNNYVNNSTNNNNQKELNVIQTLKFLEDYTRAISSEMEICYDKLRNFTEENKDFISKIKSLEQDMHNMSLNREEKNIVERKLNQNLFELKEENKALNEDVQTLEQQCEKLVNDYKQVRIELKKKLEEIADQKHELRESNNENLKLNGNLKEKENMLKYQNFQIIALEDRIVIISKEKKTLENLIERISKSHPAKEMQKVVNEMLTIYDNISQLERDKAKIEQNLKNIELNINNPDGGNSEKNNDTLSMQVKIEHDNLRNLIEDLNRKISKIVLDFLLKNIKLKTINF